MPVVIINEPALRDSTWNIALLGVDVDAYTLFQVNHTYLWRKNIGRSKEGRSLAEG